MLNITASQLRIENIEDMGSSLTQYWTTRKYNLGALRKQRAAQPYGPSVPYFMSLRACFSNI